MEPTIKINGILLTDGQAMTLRVAINHFIIDIKNNGLGDDPMGKDIANLYIEKGNEILHLMLSSSGEPK